MKARTGYAAAVAVGMVMVAVPAGAATLITSRDIEDGTVKSVDVKNGSLTGGDVKDASIGVRDLAAVLRGSPATVYRTDSIVAPPFAQTIAAGAGGSLEITVTRPGDLLIMATGSATVTEFSAGTITAGLYLDSVAIAGSAAIATGFDRCLQSPTPCEQAIAGLPIDGLIIPNVSRGTHTLAMRYTSSVSTPVAHSGSLPRITIVELG